MNPIAIIIDTVESAKENFKDGLSPLAIWNTLKPLLLEVGMSDEVLTPEKADELQERVHLLFRNAGLLKKVDL